jgi:hypothetical protein
MIGNDPENAITTRMNPASQHEKRTMKGQATKMGKKEDNTIMPPKAFQAIASAISSRRLGKGNAT